MAERAVRRAPVPLSPQASEPPPPLDAEDEQAEGAVTRRSRGGRASTLPIHDDERHGRLSERHGCRRRAARCLLGVRRRR